MLTSRLPNLFNHQQRLFSMHAGLLLKFNRRVMRSMRCTLRNMQKRNFMHRLHRWIHHEHYHQYLCSNCRLHDYWMHTLRPLRNEMHGMHWRRSLRPNYQSMRFMRQLDCWVLSMLFLYLLSSMQYRIYCRSNWKMYQ